MKVIKAVQPYIHPGHLNFKQAPYRAWVEHGGDILSSYYPPRWLHGLVYRWELPSLKCLTFNGYSLTDRDVVLMFVEPVSITFDTFPYYATHEIIPFIWDCWPCYYDKMEAWFRRHQTKTAIFTSRMEMEAMQKRCPDIHMIWCLEAVDASLYSKGKMLNERSIDLLEFGRSNRQVIGDRFVGINHVCTKVGDKFIFDNEQLYEALGDSKICICLPKSMTHPDIAQGVETLTQRYWEAMLSRTVIIGHCPKELEELVGYNPVVELCSNKNKNEDENIILDVLEHIEEYQELVDKNRETALRMGDWKGRMKWLRREMGIE